MILTNLEYYMAMTYLQQNSPGTCCIHKPPRLLSRSMKPGSGVWELVQNLDFGEANLHEILVQSSKTFHRSRVERKTKGRVTWFLPSHLRNRNK